MAKPKLKYTLEFKSQFGDRIAKVANEVATIFAFKKVRITDEQYETQIDITNYYHEFENEISRNEFAKQVGIQLLKPITFKSKKSWFSFVVFSFVSFSPENSSLILKLRTANYGTYFYDLWDGTSSTVKPLLDLIRQKAEIYSYLYFYEKHNNIVNQDIILDKILSFLENENRIIEQNS